MADYTIKNSHLTFTASSFGAEIMSLKTAEGREIIFQGDDKWRGKSPNLFPIVGMFEGYGKFVFEGRDYPIGCHGLGPISEYEVSVHTEQELEFKLSSSEETKKIYPFDFNFFVNYRLDGDRLVYTTRMKNTDNRTIYCETGTHTGFPVAPAFEGAKIVFEAEETDYTVKNNNPSVCATRPIAGNVLELKNELFSYGAVTFLGLKSKSVRLVREDSDLTVCVGLGNYPVLTFWSVPDSTYVCIEPWSCESAHYATTLELTEQNGITVLEPLEEAVFYNTVSVE